MLSGGDKREMIKMRDKDIWKLLAFSIVLVMVASGVVVGAEYSG